MPVILIEIVEDSFECLIWNLNLLAVTFLSFEFVNVENAAVEIGDATKQSF
jgi:hypothetical protein